MVVGGWRVEYQGLTGHWYPASTVADRHDLQSFQVTAGGQGARLG